MAAAITTYLGLCVDKVADYNSSFGGWLPSAEKVGHAFARQALAMVWDYTEIDPLAKVSGSWNSHVRWIELAIRHCSSASTEVASVQRGDAQHLSFR